MTENTIPRMPTITAFVHNSSDKRDCQANDVAHQDISLTKHNTSMSKSTQVSADTAFNANGEIRAPSLEELLQGTLERNCSSPSHSTVASTPATWNQSRMTSSLSRQDLRSIIDEALDILDDDDFS